MLAQRSPRSLLRHGPRHGRHHGDHDAGFTVTEVLVAMMLLTVGALALYQSMGASTKLAENSDRRSTATNLTASELEQIRSFPYDAVAMKMATGGATYFEGAMQVTDASDGRVVPSSAVDMNGITYDVSRFVTWRSARANGTDVDQAFKQVTVIVQWDDSSGSHDVRSSSAVSRTTAP